MTFCYCRAQSLQLIYLAPLSSQLKQGQKERSVQSETGLWLFLETRCFSCWCQWCEKGLIIGPKQKRIQLYINDRWRTAEKKISYGLHPRISYSECQAFPRTCSVPHKGSPTDENATCGNVQITCQGMWWVLAIFSGGCWKCWVFCRGLTRVWTRANSLFYFNPQFHSVSCWAFLQKWRATAAFAVCSGTWENLRIFLGRATSQTLCPVMVVLLWNNCKGTDNIPASFLQRLSTYILC